MAEGLIEELGLDKIGNPQVEEQEVPETAAEETQPEADATEAATEGQPAQEEPAVEEVPETPLAVEEPETEVPVEEEVEEESPYLTDFEFASEESANEASTGASPNEVAQGTNFNALSAKYGREFSSFDDVTQYIDELRQASQEGPQVVNQPKFPGLSGEESRIVAEAVESGLIAPEEIVSGKLLVDYNKLHKEDRVYEWVADSIREEEDREPTHEEIQERVDSYDDLHQDFIAKEYARVKNRERKELMDRVVAQQGQREAEQRRQEQMKQQELENFRSTVYNTVKGLEEIAGTVTKVDDKMRQGIAKIMTDPNAIKRLIWRDPSNPDIAFATHQIARLAFPKKISQDQVTASANLAKKEIIEQESNITPTSDGSTPITTQEGRTQLQRSIDSLDDWMLNGI